MDRERLKIVAVAVLTLAVLLGVGVGLKVWNDGVKEDVAEAKAGQGDYVDPVEQAKANRPPAPPEVMWIGDSYTVGAGSGTPTVEGYAQRTCSVLGWSCDFDVQGGTGFVTDPKDNGFDKVINRLEPDSQKYNPKAIIVDIGRNDHELKLDQIQTEQTPALKKLRELFPEAEVVFLAPWYIGTNESPMPEGFAAYLKDQAKAIGATVVDPNKDGWAKLPADQVHEDGVHPNTRGHATYSQALVKEFGPLAADLKKAQSSAS